MGEGGRGSPYRGIVYRRGASTLLHTMGMGWAKRKETSFENNCSCLLIIVFVLNQDRLQIICSCFYCKPY